MIQLHVVLSASSENEAKRIEDILGFPVSNVAVGSGFGNVDQISFFVNSSSDAGRAISRLMGDPEVMEVDVRFTKESESLVERYCPGAHSYDFGNFVRCGR